MSDVYGARGWSEGPRVRVRRRVGHDVSPVQSGDRMRVVLDPLRSGLRAVEREFLRLQTISVEEQGPEVLSGYLHVLDELQVIGRRVDELAERRDLSFLADRHLNVLREHCLWLARRTISAFLFMQQLVLEKELKRLVGPRGYQTYLRLEEIADAAHEAEALSGHELMARLSDGSLFREILGPGLLHSENELPPGEPTTEGIARGRLP